MSLLAAALAFKKAADGLPKTINDALEKAAQIVEDEAIRVIGTYDYGWPLLKPQTIARKATDDSPLLETGDLRDSIERDVQHDVAYVGSNSKKAVWHELGTSRIPPRPFLATAADAKHAEIGEMIGHKYHAVLVKE